ncbi:hypothetical protein CRUP_022348, partial [Coryphaenoides rupestris]
MSLPKKIKGLNMAWKFNKELMRVESSLATLHRTHKAELCARQALLAELEEQRVVQEQLEGILRWVGE